MARQLGQVVVSTPASRRKAQISLVMYNVVMRNRKLWKLFCNICLCCFFWGELLHSLDGLLTLFGTRLAVLYATMNEGLMFCILMGLWIVSITLANWTQKWWEKQNMTENPQNTVDKP